MAGQEAVVVYSGFLAPERNFRDWQKQRFTSTSPTSHNNKRALHFDIDLIEKGKIGYLNSFKHIIDIPNEV